MRPAAEAVVPGGPFPRRILHVFGVMNRGGAETMVMNAYRALDRVRLQFDFAVSTSNPGDYDEEIRGLGGRIFAHPNPATAGLVAYRTAFKATIETYGPFAAVHSHVHHFSGVVLETASRAGVPQRLAHSHSTNDGRADSTRRRVYRAMMRRLISQHSTHLLGCSPEACEALYGRRWQADPRVRVMPNAIMLAPFRDVRSDARVLRRNLLLPDDGPLVGHVGSFNGPKNHEFLLAVFAALRSRRPDACLVCAGDGPLRAGIEQSAREQGLSGAVHFLGVRRDIPEVLGVLDLFLLPSRWEGFPVSLVEAQAAGLPCVVADSVTATADLGLGLVRFVALDAGVHAWTDALMDALETRRPDREQCCQTLERAGYDAAGLGDRLSTLYLDADGPQTQRNDRQAAGRTDLVFGSRRRRRGPWGANGDRPGSPLRSSRL